MVDAHSELMTQYPWGSRAPCRTRATTHRTRAPSTAARSCSATPDSCRGEARDHSYTAIVGSNREPRAPRLGPGHYGPFGAGRRCAADQTPPPMPSECDDGPFGRGTGGRLRYKREASRARLAPRSGSPSPARTTRSPRRAAEFGRLIADPRGCSRDKRAARERLGALVEVVLPGNERLQRVDRVGQAEPRRPDPGREGPGDPLGDQGKEWTSEGACRASRWVGAGFPDYPWLFGIDGEYTAHARVALGQFGPIKDHMRALRDISELLSDGSGVVVHEVVADGSDLVRQGPAQRRTRRRARRSTTSTPTRSSSSRAPSR